MDQWIKFISYYHKIPKDTQAELRNVMQRIELPKGKQVLKKNDYCEWMYFLESGLIASLYAIDDKIRTSWFYTPGIPFTSWYSFVKDVRGKEILETQTQCILWKISKKDWNLLVKKRPELESFARKFAEEQLAEFNDYYSGYQFKSAMERYEYLLEGIPEIEAHVNLGIIASYLGISQETLSRLRATPKLP